MAEIKKSTREAWVDAAVAATYAGGLSAIRIEALARNLGVTKGSFYWHFANRHELVQAVMARWEHEATEQMIEYSSAGGTPEEKLKVLLDRVTRVYGVERGAILIHLEAEREGVGAEIERVSGRRAEYVRDLLIELGVSEQEASRRAISALASVLGLELLMVSAPGLVARELTDRDAYLESIYARLTGGDDAS